MINELMMRFAQIRSSYARKRFGNLSDEDKALIDYENFCLELIKEVDQLTEVIEKVREYGEETISYKEILARDNWEYRVKTMLEILNKVKG